MMAENDSVYLVERCIDIEYGCREVEAVFGKEEDAVDFAKRNGMQMEDEYNGNGDFRDDFCAITCWMIR